MSVRSRGYAVLLAIGALAGCSNEPVASSGSGTTTASETASTGASTSTSSHVGVGGGDAGAGLSLRVLFVGNSYTFVNDLPGWVHRLGESSGVASVAVDSVAVPSTTLAQHVTSTGAVDRIREGGFTHVVIQGQSVEPLLDPAGFEGAAATLAGEVKKVGAAPVFYETWARAAGDVVYEQPWSGGSPAAMQAGLRGEYQKVAGAAESVVAPAGDAWEKALSAQPSMGLFAADGSHPSVYGTYLVACVFHARLTGKSPVGITDRPAEVTAAEAAILQGLAEGAALP